MGPSPATDPVESKVTLGLVLSVHDYYFYPGRLSLFVTIVKKFRFGRFSAWILATALFLFVSWHSLFLDWAYYCLFFFFFAVYYCKVCDGVGILTAYSKASG